MPVNHKITNARTIEVQNRNASGVLQNSLRFIQANGTTQAPLAASDTDIQVGAVSPVSGTLHHISDQQLQTPAYEIIGSGLDDAITHHSAQEFILASARVLAISQVIVVNNVVGGLLQNGEVFSNITQVNNVGRVAAMISLNQLDGALTVNGVNSIGASSVNIDFAATNQWNKDIYGEIKAGTTLTIAGDTTVYTVTSDVTWTETGPATQAVPITPTLTQATVGAEAITLTGPYLVVVHGLENAAVATDALSGATSTVTCDAYSVTESHEFYPSLSNQFTLFVKDNIDGKEFTSDYGKGNCTFTYGIGAIPTVSTAFSGNYILPVDTVLDPTKQPSCAEIFPCNNNRAILTRANQNPYNMKDLSLESFSVEHGNTVTPDNSQTEPNTIRRFDITLIDPMVNLSISQTDEATFSPETIRTGNEKFHFTYEHNPHSTDAGTRLIHIIPAAAQTQFPTRENTNEKLYHGMAFKGTVCSTLPQEILVIY